MARHTVSSRLGGKPARTQESQDSSPTAPAISLSEKDRKSLESQIREQMPGMRIVEISRALPARPRPDTLLAVAGSPRRRPIPQAAADSRRARSAAEASSGIPRSSQETYFVTVEPIDLGDDPVAQVAARRHVPVVGKRIVALPD